MEPTLKQRMSYIAAALRSNLLAAIGFAFLYFLFNLATVLYIYENIGGFYASMRFSYTIPFTIFTVILSLVFGIAAVLVLMKIREIRLKSAGLGLSGILLGGLAAGCPGCYFGLFPVVLSFFGISATLAILPFNGLELQVLGILALCISIITLAKETVIECEVPKTRQKRKK